jgi:outer membrane biosynthesis protein TonB
MRRTKRIVLLITLALAMPVLAGCSNFDPDSLDVFGLNEKKKLPGDRRAVFPEGVPGVSQGIPPEYLKGNQPAPETAAASLPPEPEKPAAAPPPKKTVAVKRKPKPRAATVQQQQQQAPAAQQAPVVQQPAPWPDQQQAAPPAQSSSSAPWPNAAPPSGTFSR